MIAERLFSPKCRIIWRVLSFKEMAVIQHITLPFFCPLISRKLESLAFIMIFLFCSTPEFRNAFLKTIRQIIRDSVRRMNLPVTNSQSYNGNGANSGTAPKRGIIWGHIWQHWIQFHLRYCNRVIFDALRSKCICNAAVSFIHCKLT